MFAEPEMKEKWAGGRNPCIRIIDLVVFFVFLFLFLHILVPWQEALAAHNAALPVVVVWRSRCVPLLSAHRSLFLPGAQTKRSG